MSTLVELAGFVCAVIAATLAGGPVAGFATAAVSLLLIGYATEDHAAAMHLNKIVSPVRARIALARNRRAQKRQRAAAQ